MHYFPSSSSFFFFNTPRCNTFSTGLSVAMWSNILSAIILYIVIYIDSVDIFFHFPKFLIVAVGFPLILAVLEVSVTTTLVATDDYAVCMSSGSPLSLILDGVYYWGRLLSIIYNFIVFFLITRKLKMMGIDGKPSSDLGTLNPVVFSGVGTHTREATSSTTNTTSNNTSTASPTSTPHIELASNTQSLAIYALVERMKYYPFVQAICRSGAAWNEFDNYRYSTYGSALLANICSPSTGACYFIVFLVRMCSPF
jgi:hypothetical protein